MFDLTHYPFLPFKNTIDHVSAHTGWEWSATTTYTQPFLLSFMHVGLIYNNKLLLTESKKCRNAKFNAILELNVTTTHCQDYPGQNPDRYTPLKPLETSKVTISGK